MDKKFLAFLFFPLLAAWAGVSISAYAATPEGPPTYGNPDAPWGKRRKVMEIDRTRIALYRSGKLKPVYATNFSDPQELKSKWTLLSDDQAQIKSCRRPGNISVSSTGLKLDTKLATDCQAKPPHHWSTASMASNFEQKYGFFEATIKIDDITGLNNAFWLVTDDKFEIDVAEVHYPGTLRTTLHNWNDYSKHWRAKDVTSVGYANKFKDNFSKGYHDFGVLWTGNVIVYEIDGEPINVLVTNGNIHKAAKVLFSTAIMTYAGKIVAHPENHAMHVKSLRIFAIAPTKIGNSCVSNLKPIVRKV